MRIATIVAAALFTVGGLTTAELASASITQHELNIPRQPLDAALKDLARQTGVQVGRFSDAVNGDTLVGPIAGNYSAEAALKTLLAPTKLTYRTLNDRAIIVLRREDIAQLPAANTLSTAGDSSPSTRDGSTAQGGEDSSGATSDQGSFWSRLRLAQTTPGVAQSANSVNSSSAPSNPSSATESTVLQEIVVTAVRRTEGLSTVAVGISAISGAELEARSASSLADFVSQVPGLNVQSFGTPGTGVVAIRGISPQGAAATVATYIDNISIGGAGNGTENAWYGPDIDPADLERVEVLKGPQGTLYGASSLGGVIKYVTKTPSLTTAEVNTSEELNDVRGGSPGTKIRASVSTPIIENELALRASGYYEYTGGYIDDVGIGGQDVNRGYKSGMRATLLYQPLDNLKIKLNATIQNSVVDGNDITDDNGLTASLFQPLYGYFEQKRYTPESYKVQTKMYSSDIQWDTDLGSLISATSYSSYNPRQDSDMTSQAVFFGGLISPTDPAGAIAKISSDQSTQEFRFESKRLGIFEFVAGTFYQHQAQSNNDLYTSYDTTGQVNPSGFLGAQTGATTLDEYAGFGDATVYILPQLDVTAGYRYSDVQQQVERSSGGPLYGAPITVEPVVNFAEVNQTYLAGIRWRVTDEVMLYGRAATGYRPGGQRGIPPGAPPGFGDTYNSDNIRSFEAGVKVRTLGGRLTFSGDAYVINWSNIQTLIVVGIYNTDGNAGTAQSKGGEFEATYVPFDGLTLAANTAYTNARFTETSATANTTDGERLAYVPEWTRTVSVNYMLPFGPPFGTWKPEVGGEYAYRSSQLDASLPPITLPGYTTFGLHAGVHFDDKKSLRFYVNNLTNNRGIVGSGGNVGYGIPYGVVYQQPVTFGLMFSQKF
jgi:outer membrane receptor protein involved in Fe transport